MKTLDSADRLRPQPLPPLRRSTKLLVTAATALMAVLALATTADAVVLQVNSIADTSDNNWGDSLCSTGAIVVDPNLGPRAECTLRAAIEEANAWPGRDEVRFVSSLLYDVNGVAWFNPATDYQPITEPIEIDGTTAPSYDPARTPRVVLVENGGSYGLNLLPTADGSTIRGLTFGGFFYGIYLNGTDGVWIDRCAFGVHDHVDPYMFRNANGVGIHVNIQATNTWIGAKVQNGAFVGLGNTISGNGVGIENAGTNTHVVGNKIGTDPTGTRREARVGALGQLFTLGNTADGIRVENGVGLEIGRVLVTGTLPNLSFVAKGNLISNNGGHGIDIVETSNQPTLPGMTIVANQIGTDTTGLLDFGNALSGIYVSDAAADLVIGNLLPGGANRVAGNDGDGIETGLGGVGDTVIEGNFVGVAADGISPLPNGFQGIRLDGGDPVRVEANVVGHSPNHGILIGNDPLQSVGTVRVIGNFVGMNESGDALPNGLSGIRVEEGDVTIRDNSVGNGQTGIAIAEGASLIDVFSNYVGTDALGRDQGNSGAGILVTSTVGGNEIGALGKGNVIGWNGGSGILMDQAANANLVVANKIGVHPNGIPMPNENHGIRMRAGAGTFPAVIGSDLTTSSLDFEERANRIAYNVLDAISMQDGTEAAIRGNRITNNGSLSIDLNENGNTPNDFGDADLGANRLQNSPELDPVRTRVDPVTGELLVEYRVTSDVGNAAYPLTIDFYLADPTGLQPLTYLGSDSYPAAEAHLQRRVQFTPVVPIPVGLQNIVATATSALSETSEVGAPVAVPEPGLAAGLAAGLVGLLGFTRRASRSA
ncbi:MAG: right-handed parallel beta-helix repeat-containing protein [Deltaproteobacteria bacterium]|nr:right-handed parallel beta-helix repeat-containing protein [Deltaproteobacteria bacterium]